MNKSSTIRPDIPDEPMSSMTSLTCAGMDAYAKSKLFVGDHFVLYGMLTSKNNLYFYREEEGKPPCDAPVWAQMRKKDDTHVLKIYGVCSFEPHFRNPAFLDNIVQLDKHNKDSLFLHMNYECGSTPLKTALEFPAEQPSYTEEELHLINVTTARYAEYAPKETPKVLAAIRTAKNNLYFIPFEKDEHDLSTSDLDELRRANDTVVEEVTCIYDFMTYRVPKKLMALLIDLHSENANAHMPKRIFSHRTMVEFWGEEAYRNIRKKAGQEKRHAV